MKKEKECCETCPALSLECCKVCGNCNKCEHFNAANGFCNHLQKVVKLFFGKPKDEE